jgi:hypothetical protein
LKEHFFHPRCKTQAESKVEISAIFFRSFKNADANELATRADSRKIIILREMVGEMAEWLKALVR